MTSGEQQAVDWLAAIRKRYAGEDKQVLIHRVPLTRLPHDAPALVIRYLLELHTERLGLDVMAYPGPQDATSAIRAAVAEEREENVKAMRRYLQFNNQRAVSWHEVEDCIATIRARSS